MNEEPQVAGISPWLPWPLSAWPWCSEPVRAERLAALRIGLAAILLADILINYAPGLTDFFTRGSLGDASAFDWRFHAPRTTWNLLRGFGDEMNLYLALGLWLAASAWILLVSFSRQALMDRNPPAQDRTGIAFAIAITAHAWYCAGVWARIVASKQPSEMAWIVPLAQLSLLCLFAAIELASRLRDPNHRVSWLALWSGYASAVCLLVVGVILARMDAYDPEAWWVALLGPWQQSDAMMVVAMSLWVAFTVLLLVGCWTKFAAVMVWLLGMSFGNLNPNIDNAGDTIRMLILFYLMLCPCGAVWSIDAWRSKRVGPVFVHPWAIRLLFLQMIFIYSMNGYYKILGSSWLDGSSLHYVMGDLALARVSPMLLPMPMFLTRMLSWTVLAWETTFPALVLWKWTRRPALVFGVLFHLGIFASMELAAFPLYAICLYLPLVPWDRWCADRTEYPHATETP